MKIFNVILSAFIMCLIGTLHYYGENILSFIFGFIGVIVLLGVIVFQLQEYNKYNDIRRFWIILSLMEIIICYSPINIGQIKESIEISGIIPIFLFVVLIIDLIGEQP